MVVKSNLMGFVRRSNNGGALKVSVSKDAFESANRYTSADGTEYVGMIIRLNRLRNILSGEQEVTNICQLLEDGQSEAAS